MGVLVNKMTDRVFGCTVCLVHHCLHAFFVHMFFFSFTYFYIHPSIHSFLCSSLIGGDCLDFNVRYPNCSVESPWMIGNGRCHGESYNTEECGFDGELVVVFRLQ